MTTLQNKYQQRGYDRQRKIIWEQANADPFVPHEWILSTGHEAIDVLTAQIGQYQQDMADLKTDDRRVCIATIETWLGRICAWTHALDWAYDKAAKDAV